jgi:hypothetical protein
VTPVSDGGGGNLERGPAASGSLVRFTLDPDRVVAGIQAAPVVAAALASADRLWDTGIGPLIPARPSN